MTRSLIVGCSRRKVATEVPLPALHRYDGPLFRVLRKFRREHPDDASDLDILVVSAKFGLIRSDRPIPHYDRSMDRERAIELRPSVLAELRRTFKTRRVVELCICLGRQYEEAVRGWDEILPEGVKATTITGTIGRRQSALKLWLNRGANTERSNRSPNTSVKLLGRDLAANKDHHLDILRDALSKARARDLRIQTWYVEVDGQHLPLKWAVSQLTGLPVSRFNSTQASAALTSLGMEVFNVGAS